MNPQEQEQKENSYRRTVLTTIETLIDIESTNEIGVHLPNLHGVAWDEVIEERFVNKQCGFPACSGSPPKTKNGQMYHIDKKEGKIYETCKQRSKFCSVKCYQKSFFVRNQLEEQPLWITGLSDERTLKKYEVPDEKFVSPVYENERDTDDVVEDKTPEFVADSIIAQVKNMKLDEEYEEPKEKDPDEPEQYKLTEDDKDFIRSIRQFKAASFASPSSKGSVQAPPKSAKVTLSSKDQKKEEEVLSKLREKYGNKNSKQKKPPIIIDPHSMAKKTENKSDEKDTWLTTLLKGWFTSETRRMVKEGARPSGAVSEQMLMDLLKGKRPDAESGVNLPNLDKYNVKEKRLNIFLHSVRSHWLELEARLHVTPTRRDLLSRVAATFELNSENIVGWSKRGLNSIAIALFLVVCLIDVELGDDFFKKDHPNPELSSLSSELCGIDFDALTGLQNFIKAQIA